MADLAATSQSRTTHGGRRSRPMRHALPTIGGLSILLMAASMTSIPVRAAMDRDGDHLSDRWERHWGVSDPGRWDTDQDA